MSNIKLKKGKIEKQFANRLMKFVETSGQSITFISEQIGCHSQTLYRWLADKSSIKLSTCDLIENHIQKNKDVKK